MKQRTAHIANLIKQNITEVDSKVKVILYGSRAKGTEKTESDWDILVITDSPVSLKKERQFRQHLYPLELEIEEPFSLFVYSVDEWENKQRLTPFYYDIKNTGIVL